MSDEKPKPKQPQQSIDDQIKAIKNGDRWKQLDHVADWYSEKCTFIRTEERLREHERNK